MVKSVVILGCGPGGLAVANGLAAAAAAGKVQHSCPNVLSFFARLRIPITC